MAIDLERRSALSAKITASTNNIPTTFGTGAGSKIITDIASAQHLVIINETTGRIAINYSSGDPNNAPSAVEAYCLGNASLTMDNVKVSQVIYIKSDTGSALTTGTVECFVW